MSNFKKIKDASTKISKDLAKVEEHYQNYPHPFRDPNQEKERLLTVCGEFLGELNHFLYKGKENFDIANTEMFLPQIRKNLGIDQ